MHCGMNDVPNQFRSGEGDRPIDGGQPSESARIAYMTLALVMLLWSGNSIVGRAVRDDIGPLTLAFVRWLGASLILLPFAWRHVARDRAVLLASWKIVLMLALFGVAAFNALLYSGLHYTSATNGLLLQAAIPAGVLLADRLIFGQRAPLWQKIGVLLSTLGVVIVVAKADIGLLAKLHLGIGDVLVLGGVVVWSLYTSLLRLKPLVHPLSLLLVTFGIAALCMAPLAAGEWLAGNRPRPGPGLYAACAYVAIFPSILAYLMFNAAVGRIGAGRAGQTISLMPLFGSLLAAALLGEQIHAYHLAGMALILGGIALSIVAGRLQPPRGP